MAGAHRSASRLARLSAHLYVRCMETAAEVYLRGGLFPWGLAPGASKRLERVCGGGGRDRQKPRKKGFRFLVHRNYDMSAQREGLYITERRRRHPSH